MNLVTGATGHIGNVLVQALLKRGEQVRALVLPGEDTAPLKGLDVEQVPGDVLKPETLRPALQGVRNVFHLAGIISIMPGRNKLVEAVNVQGTLNVVQAACQAAIRRLVYTSSIHAIARAPHGVKIDEALPYDPDNPYGAYDRSKAEASLAVQKAVGEGLDAVIVCPTGVIGPYDYRRSELGQLILDCATGKPQPYVDGAYDFVDVRDVADGLLLAEEKGRRGESYILSGERLTVRSLLATIQGITGLRNPYFRIPMRLAKAAAQFTPLYYRLMHAKPRFTPYSLEVLESNSDISHDKAQTELGYHPRPAAESIADTIRWFLENRSLWSHSKAA